MLFLFLIFAFIPFSTQLRCHSCLTHCKTINGKVDSKACDCVSKEEEMCQGNACFAKIEIFTDEKTAIMQKGCISEVPGGETGCQYASNAESLHCYCQEDMCNYREKLNNFMTNRLPTVECCGCSERLGEHCPADKCLRKCRGNYCVVDFDGVEQGCGLGFPRLQSFLRMDNYLDYQGSAICARYEATTSTVMNGCTCTEPSGSCNGLNRTRESQLKNVIERRQDNQNYCYSLTHKSNKPFGQEVFTKSTTCEGQYCFISLTTSEIVLESADFKHNVEDHDEFIGINRPRYELLAGCLKVDDDKKINVGCTTEYTSNSTEPLSKHCICESHLCNFHHLVSGDKDGRPRATQKQKMEIRLFTLLLFITLFTCLPATLTDVQISPHRVQRSLFHKEYSSLMVEIGDVEFLNDHGFWIMENEEEKAIRICVGTHVLPCVYVNITMASVAHEGLLVPPFIVPVTEESTVFTFTLFGNHQKLIGESTETVNLWHLESIQESDFHANKGSLHVHFILHCSPMSDGKSCKVAAPAVIEEVEKELEKEMMEDKEKEEEDDDDDVIDVPYPTLKDKDRTSMYFLEWFVYATVIMSFLVCAFMVLKYFVDNNGQRKVAIANMENIRLSPNDDHNSISMEDDIYLKY